MKQRHILLIILTILILIFLFFPTLKLAKDRHDHQSRERQNEIKNLIITIYRYSPATLPPCEERLYLISTLTYSHNSSSPACVHKLSKANLT